MNIRIYTFCLLIIVLSSCSYNPSQKKGDVRYEPIFEEETIPMYVYTFNDSLYKYKYSRKDSIEINVNIYKPKEILFPILDSIIYAVQMCQDYEKSKLEFAISTLESREKLNIIIENINIHNFNYAAYDGFFNYKGFRFNHWGGYKDYLVIEKIGNEKFKTYDSSMQEYTINDPLESSWHYIYENGNIINIAYYNCGKEWYRKY